MFQYASLSVAKILWAQEGPSGGDVVIIMYSLVLAHHINELAFLLAELACRLGRCRAEIVPFGSHCVCALKIIFRFGQANKKTPLAAFLSGGSEARSVSNGAERASHVCFRSRQHGISSSLSLPSPAYSPLFTHHHHFRRLHCCCGACSPS